jgi:hypothetical protein
MHGLASVGPLIIGLVLVILGRPGATGESAIGLLSETPANEPVNLTSVLLNDGHD